MPKELLEAKKLELIQEKVDSRSSRCVFILTVYRSMPKGPQRTHNNAKTKSRFERKKWKQFGKENEQSVVAVVDVAEVVETLTHEDPDTQGRPLLVGALLLEAHLRDEKPIHTYLAGVAKEEEGVEGVRQQGP